MLLVVYMFGIEYPLLIESRFELSNSFINEILTGIYFFIVSLLLYNFFHV